MNNLNGKNTSNKTVELVFTALFAGIIVALAYIPFIGYIPLGFTNATTIHIPVILGALFLGPKKGGFLGFVFGMTSMLKSTFEPTVTSFCFSPFYSLGEIHGGIGSVIICFLPRILIGIVPFYVYKAIAGRKDSGTRSVVALGAAGIAGSMTNTILVLGLIYVFFKDAFATVNQVSVDAVYKVILGIVGVNGVPEAIVAAIISVAVGKALMTRVDLYKADLK